MKRKLPRNPHPVHLGCANWTAKQAGAVRIGWCRKHSIEMNGGSVARECFDKRKETQ